MYKILDNIIHKLIYTCEEVTYLIEKKASSQALTISENIRMKCHLAVCKFCKAYKRKVNSIDEAMIRLSKKSKDLLKESEIKEFKKSLAENF